MGNIKTTLLEVKSKGSTILNNATTVVSSKTYLKKIVYFITYLLAFASHYIYR